MTTPLRIALVAPPLERVPPRAYGGTERIVYGLVVELQRRGHHVTLFASGDSDVPCELVPTVPEALRPAGFGGDAAPYFYQTILDVLARAREFDLIHSHLEWASVPLMAVSPVPVVSTFHGRLDFPFAERLLSGAPPGLIAISASQASAHPGLSWSIVHNGLNLADAPFERRAGDDLCFVGRIDPEKGVLEAIEVARLSGRRLRIAAKVGTLPFQVDFYEQVFKPALEGRSDVEYLGEITGPERDELVSQSYATLMPGAWPEPFGLVAIESLACGTPIVARRVGALPEIIRPEVDGFFGDDVQQMAFLLDRIPSLDRAAIRESVLERFSAARMADDYLEVYASVLAARGHVLDVTEDRVTPLSSARASAARAARQSATPEIRGAMGHGGTAARTIDGTDAAATSGADASASLDDEGARPAQPAAGGSLHRGPVGRLAAVDPRIVLATAPERLLLDPPGLVSDPTSAFGSMTAPLASRPTTSNDGPARSSGTAGGEVRGIREHGGEEPPSPTAPTTLREPTALRDVTTRDLSSGAAQADGRAITVRHSAWQLPGGHRKPD